MACEKLKGLGYQITENIAKPFTCRDILQPDVQYTLSPTSIQAILIPLCVSLITVTIAKIWLTSPTT